MAFKKKAASAAAAVPKTRAPEQKKLADRLAVAIAEIQRTGRCEHVTLESIKEIQAELAKL